MTLSRVAARPGAFSHSHRSDHHPSPGGGPPSHTSRLGRRPWADRSWARCQKSLALDRAPFYSSAFVCDPCSSCSRRPASSARAERAFVIDWRSLSVSRSSAAVTRSWLACLHPARLALPRSVSRRTTAPSVFLVGNSGDQLGQHHLLDQRADGIRGEPVPLGQLADSKPRFFREALQSSPPAPSAASPTGNPCARCSGARGASE